MSERNVDSRRGFLKTSTAAVAGSALAGGLNLGSARMAHAQGSDQLKFGLIGCGGRGNGAINDIMRASDSVRLVAISDAFENRVEGTARRWRDHGDFKDRVDLPDERVFSGLDAHKQLLETDCDIVLNASPPGFRPQQYADSIRAGKHVFMEKPCCVDAPGYKILVEANKMADEKGLKVVVGFQRRHQRSYVETMKRIHDGALGRLTLLRGYWNGGGIWIRRREPTMTEMEYQVHNWYHFCWLSGDNICEQHVHNLDICNWAMDAHPVEANGMGGCIVRYEGGNRGVGQIFDCHFVEFTYADGTKMYSQCRHIPGCWNNVSESIEGVLGTSNANGRITGENEWRFSGDNPNAMIQEHRELVQSIQEDREHNEGWYGATSSMTAVLGRMATYSGRIVRWDEAVEKGESEFPENLAWDAPAPVEHDEHGDYPIPVPGRTDPYAV